MLGLSKVQLGIAIVLLALIPVAFIGGRWHQASIDKVQEKVAELQRTQKALEDAKAASDRIVSNQVAAQDVVRAELEATRGRLDLAEQEAQAKDEQVRAAEQAMQKAQVAASSPAAPPMASCADLGDDDLARLRRSHPAGPLRRRQHPAARPER